MGNAFRNQPFSSHVPQHRTSPVYDYNLHNAYKVYYPMAVIAVTFLLILPGVRGLNRCWMLLRVYAALWIGSVLLICNYSSWYGAVICTKTQYKPHTAKNTPQEIQAEVGLHISLRGINITLVEKQCESYEVYTPPFPFETIHYNEHFSWSNPWSQGKKDYSKHGGKFEQQYRAAKYRGVPYPITHIAEYFTIDGEQIRWYRKFRIAGWYTHILMWTAFASHLFSVLLFMVSIRKGLWQMVITGSLVLLACIMYSVIILNDPILEIHFPSQTLTPQFKGYFWMNLGTGLATFIIAWTLLVLEPMVPLKVAAFFNHDATQDDSIFQNDEEYEQSFLQNFTPVSIKRLSRRNHSSVQKRKLKRRTRQPSPQEFYDDTPQEYEQDKTTRPTSVVYINPEIEVIRDSCTSRPSSGEFELEVQIAQITIHSEDD